METCHNDYWIPIPDGPMSIDVNTFIGAYPWRPLPQVSPEALVAELKSQGIEEAWVTYLPSLFWKDPMLGNSFLYAAISAFPGLRAVPVVHPGLPRWDDAIDQAIREHVPCLRVDPGRFGIDPVGSEMRRLAARCGEDGLPLMVAMRLEDGRGRHPLDVAPDLTPAAIRSLVRSDPALRLVVTQADRDQILEVHFGSTPDESARIFWDISWIWGAPEDHLEEVIHTVGVSQFLLGTGQPLRLHEAALAKLELARITQPERDAIESGNALGLLQR